MCGSPCPASAILPRLSLLECPLAGPSSGLLTGLATGTTRHAKRQCLPDPEWCGIETVLMSSVSPIDMTEEGAVELEDAEFR